MLNMLEWDKLIQKWMNNETSRKEENDLLDTSLKIINNFVRNQRMINRYGEDIES